MKTTILILCAFGAAAFAEVVFHRAQLKIENEVLDVELAETPEQLERGLMFRKSLSENSGMIFIYKDEQPLAFWMKNTFIPLSIGFFNKNRELIDIQEMAPVKSEMQLEIPTYKSRGAALYALEVNSGWFKRHKIKTKDKFQFIKTK